MKLEDAAVKVFPGKLAPLRDVWIVIDELMTARGLSRDVKTIYVSYTDPSLNLIGAVHPDPVTESIELALAIPDKKGNSPLYDATHLKWRTLPFAIRVGSTDVDPEMLESLIDQGMRQVTAITPRPSDEFMGRRPLHESRRHLDEA